MTHIWFIYRLSLPVFELSQITLVVGSAAAAPVSAHHRSGGNNNHGLYWRIKGSRSSQDMELNCLGDDDDDDDYCDFIWCAGEQSWRVDSFIPAWC